MNIQKFDSELLSVLSRRYRDLPMTASARIFCLHYARSILLRKKVEFAPPVILLERPGFCFLSVYEDQCVIQCVSGRGETILETIDDAVAKIDLFRESMKLSFCFLFDEKPVTQNAFVLGVDAIALKQNDDIAFFKNSVPIHHQLHITQLLEKLSEKAGLPKEAYLDSATLLFSYKTIEFVEDAENKLCDWYRGNPLLIHADITEDYLKNSRTDAIQFLKTALLSKDDITYRYLFSQKKSVSEESVSAITRYFASVYQLIVTTGDHESCRISIIKMINRYFAGEEDSGFLCVNGKTQLSLNAFALLALLSFEDDFMQDEKKRLLAWIELQLSEDKTHFLLQEPEALFYPAQALLVFLAIFEKTHNQKYLEYCLSVFPHYRTMFEVSSQKIGMQTWFSKAIAKLFLITKEKQYADFVFALNDLALSAQIQPGFDEVDLTGGFSRDGNSRTTACILEGLCEAWHVASVLELKDRMIQYEQAIFLGVRALLQLQYTADNSHDCIARGGFKTSVFNLDIRIDNVQHALSVVHFVLKNQLFQ